MSRCVNELQVNRLYYRHATLKELKRLRVEGLRVDRKIVNSVRRTTDPFKIGGILIEAHLFEVLARVYELNDAMTVFNDFRAKKYEAVFKEFEEADFEILADIYKFMESEKKVCNNMSLDEAVAHYLPKVSKPLGEQSIIAYNKLQAVCKENRELSLMFMKEIDKELEKSKKSKKTDS